MCYYRDRSRNFKRNFGSPRNTDFYSTTVPRAILPGHTSGTRNSRLFRNGLRGASSRTGRKTVVSKAANEPPAATPAGKRKDCTMAFATTPASALNPWLQILAALEKKVVRQTFETWLKPTRFSHAADRRLYVRVPSPEFQHIGDKYGDLIQEAIDLQALEFDDVSFVTAEEDPMCWNSG